MNGEVGLAIFLGFIVLVLVVAAFLFGYLFGVKNG